MIYTLFKNLLSKISLVFLTIIVIVLIILFPELCTQGAKRGLLICGNVIIPSLFPFMVCVLILMRLKFMTPMFKFVSSFCNSVFGQSTDMFGAMVLSMLGGYPIGAKLIKELYTQGKINNKTANIMMVYCVNAGPAFITLAVGVGVFSSKEIGYILLLSHIFATLINALLVSKFTRNNTLITCTKEKVDLKFTDNFVLSTGDASASILKICAFVIVFSVINSYLVYFSKDLTIFKYMVYFTEVTSAVTLTNNLIFVSFLLGFAGISIWFQLFSILKDISINRLLFILGRLMHGTISAIITFLLLKIFNFAESTFSNNIIQAQNKLLVTNISLTLSLTITIILFLIFVYTENHSRKILDDVI